MSETRQAVRAADFLSLLLAQHFTQPELVKLASDFNVIARRLEASQDKRCEVYIALAASVNDALEVRRANGHVAGAPFPVRHKELAADV
jgi:hypothetical protein